MIKGNYHLVQNSRNMFEIIEEGALYESSVMTDENFNQNQVIVVGLLSEQKKSSFCSLRSNHQIKNLQLKLYDQILSIANTNNKSQCCWRCSNQVQVTNSNKIVIGIIKKVNACSLVCWRQPCVEIRDSDDKVIFLIYSSCCQLGNIIPECCGFLRCDRPLIYQIQDNEGTKIGIIENKPKQRCGFGRLFSLKITPQNIESKKRILLINSIVLLL